MAKSEHNDGETFCGRTGQEDKVSCQQIVGMSVFHPLSSSIC